MAQQDVALLVVGQAQVAETTRLDMAAPGTVNVRREAAAIEQQHHLAAVLEGVAHRRLQRLAEGGDAALLRPIVTAIDQHHRRQRPIQHALRQGEQGVLAALGVVVTLQRRSGRAEDDGDVFQPGAHHGHVAGMVARRRFLFERGLVFLVDDDQAQPARGGEDGAAAPTTT